MRAWGSPKIPATVALGRNPGKRYASHSRRGRCGVGMRRSCPILALPPQCFRPRPERVFAPSAPCFHPLTSTKSLNVTEHPTAHWTAQQIVDAFLDDSAPSYLLRYHDSVYGHALRQRVKG